MFAPPAAEGPSAPPASMFDSMPGYEGTIAGGGGTVCSADFVGVSLVPLTASVTRHLTQYCHIYVLKRKKALMDFS